MTSNASGISFSSSPDVAVEGAASEAMAGAFAQLHGPLQQTRTAQAVQPDSKAALMYNHSVVIHTEHMIETGLMHAGCATLQTHKQVRSARTRRKAYPGRRNMRRWRCAMSSSRSTAEHVLQMQARICSTLRK